MSRDDAAAARDEQFAQHEATRYSFETSAYQTRSDAMGMADKLLLRLGVSSEQKSAGGGAGLHPEHYERLIKFATVCHLNIRWYQSSRKREMLKYRVFATFTAVIILAMPVILYVAFRSNDQALTAQIGVIITAMLGGHRTLSSMLEKRNLVRHFWKAQADLKTLLYSFEDTWRGRALEPSSDPDSGPDSGLEYRMLSAEFLADLEDQIARAKQIKFAEQEAFFARYDRAFSNLAEIAGTVEDRSRQVFDTLSAARARKTEPLEQTETAIAELEAERSAITSRIRALEAELEALEDSDREVDNMRRSAVTSALADLQRQDIATASQLSTTEARLEVLKNR